MINIFSIVVPSNQSCDRMPINWLFKKTGLIFGIVVLSLGLLNCTKKSHHKKPQAKADKSSETKIKEKKTSPEDKVKKGKSETTSSTKKEDELKRAQEKKTDGNPVPAVQKPAPGGLDLDAKSSKKCSEKNNGPNACQEGKAGQPGGKKVKLFPQELKLSKADSHSVAMHQAKPPSIANRNQLTGELSRIAKGRGLRVITYDDPNINDSIAYRFVPDVDPVKEKLERHWAERLLDPKRPITILRDMAFTPVGKLYSDGDGTAFLVDVNYQHLLGLSKSRILRLFVSHVCDYDFKFANFCLIVDSSAEEKGYLLRFEQTSPDESIISVAKVDDYFVRRGPFKPGTEKAGVVDLPSSELVWLDRVTDHLNVPVAVYVPASYDSYFDWMEARRPRNYHPRSEAPSRDPIVDNWGPAQRITQRSHVNHDEVINIQDLDVAAINRMSASERDEYGLYLADIANGVAVDKRWAPGVCKRDEPADQGHNLQLAGADTGQRAKMSMGSKSEWLQCSVDFDLKGDITAFVVASKHLKGKGRVLCKNRHGVVRDAWPIKATLKSRGVGFYLVGNSRSPVVPAASFERNYKSTGVGIGIVEGAREFVGKKGRDYTLVEGDCLFFKSAVTVSNGFFSYDDSFGINFSFDFEWTEGWPGLGCSIVVSTLTLITNSDEFLTEDRVPRFRSRCNSNDIVKRDYLRFLNNKGKDN